MKTEFDGHANFSDTRLTGLLSLGFHIKKGEGIGPPLTLYITSSQLVKGLVLLAGCLPY
jgi:hypothetical protein